MTEPIERSRPGEPVPRHTSPLIVAVHTVTLRWARQFVRAVTLLSLGTAALSWWRFTYADGPSSVVVTRGLLSRSVRIVPNDRIRGVEVETPPLHRIFGLVRVRIDAAAGAADEDEDEDEELVVDGVSRAEGDRLRTAVLTHRQAPAPTSDAPREEEFGRFDNERRRVRFACTRRNRRVTVC